MYNVFWQQESGERAGVPVVHFEDGEYGLMSGFDHLDFAGLRMGPRPIKGLNEAIDYAENVRRMEGVEVDTVEVIGPAQSLSRRVTSVFSAELGCEKDAGSLSAPTSRRYDHCQLYLGPREEGGLGIRAAWDAGRCGEGVTLVDVEEGWGQHEDLPNLQGLWWKDRTSSVGMDHGVHVMGMLGAPHDDKGIMGIAPGCRYAVVQVERDDSSTMFAGVLRAIRELSAPAVILVEQEREMCRWLPHQKVARNMPLEASWLGRMLGRLAAAKGLFLVQPAGNGRENLDEWLWPAPKDSHSIVVGAAAPFSKDVYGNYGTRVNLSGWGSHVVTCGYNQYPYQSDLQERASYKQCYTRSFGFTSAAAAMVAGCVALVAEHGWVNGKLPDALLMRKILVDSGHMNPGRIGPRPDVQAALSDPRIN